MICRRCGQDKVAGDFIWKTNGKIAHGQKCKSCYNELRDTPEFKAAQRDSHFRRLYDITLEDYDEMYRAQGGVCAICKEESNATGKNAKLHVDHDHKTGKVRGLLCYQCNIGLGFLGEDFDKIYKILDYLHLHVFKET